VRGDSPILTLGDGEGDGGVEIGGEFGRGRRGRQRLLRGEARAAAADGINWKLCPAAIEGRSCSLLRGAAVAAAVERGGSGGC
jgi:hypothetical protein